VHHHRRPSTSRLSAGLGVAVAVFAAGCGSSSHGHASSTVSAADLSSYVKAVEPIRLGVNKLLEGADPILDGYRDKRITPVQASRWFARLESTFAGFAVRAQEVVAPDPTLAAINAPYAHTYFLEDSYLATLASDLREGDFDNLPNTQDAQRLAIVEWRIKLQVIADRLHVTLPADVQQAGRGEIAPAIGS
jgi:hypothetical protein